MQKLIVHLGTTRSPDISNSVAEFLQEKYNAKILEKKGEPDSLGKTWLFDIEGFKVGLIQDDIMPLGIYAKTIESNDLVNKIADDLEPLIKDIKDDDF